MCVLIANGNGVVGRWCQNTFWDVIEMYSVSFSMHKSCFSNKLFRKSAYAYSQVYIIQIVDVIIVKEMITTEKHSSVLNHILRRKKSQYSYVI